MFYRYCVLLLKYTSKKGNKNGQNKINGANKSENVIFKYCPVVEKVDNDGIFTIVQAPINITQKHILCIALISFIQNKNFIYVSII